MGLSHVAYADGCNGIGRPQLSLGTLSNPYILWFISRPINKYHRCIFLLCILGVILGSRYLGHVFDMREISIKASALCLIFAFAEMEIIRDFTYLLDQIYNKLKSKKIEKMKNILIGGELK